MMDCQQSDYCNYFEATCGESGRKDLTLSLQKEERRAYGAFVLVPIEAAWSIVSPPRTVKDKALNR